MGTLTLALDRAKFVDWRDRFQLRVREALPGLLDGAPRRALVVAIARAETPGAAMLDVDVTAKAFAATLSKEQQHAILLIMADLSAVSSAESKL